MIQVYEPDLNHYRSNLQQHSAGGSKGGSGPKLKFGKLEKNTSTVFYLMPPWSQRGLLAREIWECFNLPKKHRHVGYKSYEIFKPGISSFDPVVKVLQDLSSAFPKETRSMFPKLRYYANVIVYAKASVGSQKYEMVDHSQGVQTIGFPVSVFNDIISKSLEPTVGSIVNPYAAVAVVVTSTGTGMDTEYKTELTGSRTVTGFVPTRVNLFDPPEKGGFGPEVMQAALGSLPNLELFWPLPGETEHVQAQTVARDIKAFLVSKSPVPGAVAGPEGSLMFGGPPPTPTPQFSPPVVPGFPVNPNTAAGVPALPPAAGISMEQVLKVDLKTDFPPQTDQKSPPMCFKRFAEVQNSPNFRWCGSCPWKLPCKVGSST